SPPRANPRLQNRPRKLPPDQDRASRAPAARLPLAGEGPRTPLAGEHSLGQRSTGYLLLMALAAVTREAGEGQVEAGGEGVVLELAGREELRDVRVRKGQELLKRGALVAGPAKDLLGLVGPAVETFAEHGHVGTGIVGEAVVG